LPVQNGRRLPETADRESRSAPQNPIDHSDSQSPIENRLVQMMISTIAQLPDDEAHVWQVALDMPVERVESLHRLLANDERKRAQRFYFERDRRAFIIGRGLLRTILGRYLNTEPTRLEFQYNPHGKPALARGDDAINFNVSHSGEVALLAFVRGRGIGVDVEYMRRELEFEKVAERVFSYEELTALRNTPAEHRREAFFNGWARKEAYIKANGQGVSLPLDEIVVSIAPDEPAELLLIKGTFDAAERWRMRQLRPGSDYAAALLVEGSGWRLVCHHWPKE
jgi:4'-phosphopantetheinyl transferase